jgi:hypothetical protein
LFCLIRHSPIIAPIGAQRQAPLTERLQSRALPNENKLTLTAARETIEDQRDGVVCQSFDSLSR